MDSRQTPEGVEIKSARTATSATFRRSDGTRETRIHENPINYQTPDGEWRPIEEGFRREGASIVNGANSFKIQIPDNLNSSPLRFSVGDQ